MDEYISRNETINAIKSLESSMPAKDNYAKGYDAALGRVLIAVREVPPAADVKPAKRGYWIWDGNKEEYICSECGKGNLKYSTVFCPDCGARTGGDIE